MSLATATALPLSPRIESGPSDAVVSYGTPLEKKKPARPYAMRVFVSLWSSSDRYLVGWRMVNQIHNIMKFKLKLDLIMPLMLLLVLLFNFHY